VPWAVNITSVIDVDETRIVRKYSSASKYLKTTNLTYKSIPVPDINAPDLTYSSIEIIVNRDVFYLDHSAIVVVLNIRVVVKSRVKTQAHIPYAHTYSYTGIVTNIKVEFSVRIHRKGDSLFVKNEALSVIIEVARIDLICPLHSVQEWT
jgi:hypothetical protein